MELEIFDLICVIIAIASVGICCWYCGRVSQAAVGLARKCEEYRALAANWKATAYLFAGKLEEMGVKVGELPKDGARKDAA